jgi:predicted nucleic acid-binding protein
MIIVDTNVIAEITRINPDPSVMVWLNRQPSLSVWTTSISILEVRLGLEAMPAGKRRAHLTDSFERWLSQAIEGRVAPYDEYAARRSASLAAERQRLGRSGELRDTMIAGIVLATRATLATRNIRHFEDIAASVVNPWDAK